MARGAVIDGRALRLLGDVGVTHMAYVGEAILLARPLAEQACLLVGGGGMCLVAPPLPAEVDLLVAAPLVGLGGDRLRCLRLGRLASRRRGPTLSIVGGGGGALAAASFGTKLFREVQAVTSFSCPPPEVFRLPPQNIDRYCVNTAGKV